MTQKSTSQPVSTGELWAAYERQLEVSNDLRTAWVEAADRYDVTYIALAEACRYRDELFNVAYEAAYGKRV